MSDYFIDYDGHNDPWVWRENGARPIKVLNLRTLPAGHPLLDLIRAAVEGEVREEWGVRHEDGVVCHVLSGPTAERDIRSIADAWEDEFTPVRRTVITGAWEEER